MKKTKDRKVLELAHNEISESWEFQLHAHSALLTKSNWMVAINGVLLAAVVASSSLSLFAQFTVFILLLISMFFAMSNYFTLGIRRGVGNRDWLNALGQKYEVILEALSEKKVKNIEQNDSTLAKMGWHVNISAVFFIIALTMVLIFLLINTLCYVR